MRSSQHFNLLPWAGWLAAMILVLSLTSTGSANAQSLTQTQTQIVNNLSSASGSIKNQISAGLTGANSMAGVANSGYILDPTAYSSLTITEQQRQTYNSALTTFLGTSFYNAQQFFNDQARDKVANMQEAIHDLANAAVDLQTAVTVNQIVASASDSPSAQAAQAVIANSGLSSEISTEQVASFNNSLQMVNTYATQAGAFFSAANNQTITSNVDMFAANYNKSLYNATAGYQYGVDVLSVTFTDTYAIGFHGFLTDKQVSAEQFFTNVGFYQ